MLLINFNIHVVFCFAFDLAQNQMHKKTDLKGKTN